MAGVKASSLRRAQRRAQRHKGPRARGPISRLSTLDYEKWGSRLSLHQLVPPTDSSPAFTFSIALLLAPFPIYRPNATRDSPSPLAGPPSPPRQLSISTTSSRTFLVRNRPRYPLASRLALTALKYYRSHYQ
jgi:hypothetical protein